MLSTYGPQRGADVEDWPLTYDELEPYYAEVERAIGVAGSAGANPFAAWRSGPFPMPPGPRCTAPACRPRRPKRLGFHPYAAPTAANSIPYDGRPACNNCGFCAFFGCPIHAKGDPRGPPDTDHGDRAGRTDGRDLRVPDPHRGRRATGVDTSGRTVERTMDGPARRSWPAARSRRRACSCCRGWTHPALGRYLMVHFQTIVVGHPAMRLHADRGRAGDPRARRCHDPGRARRGGRRGGRAALVPRRHGRAQRGRDADRRGQDLPARGPPHAAIMTESRRREHMWAFIMQGEDLAYADQRGRPRPHRPRRARLPGGPR